MRNRAFGVEIECGWNSDGSGGHSCNCGYCGYDDYGDSDYYAGVNKAVTLLRDNGLNHWTEEIHEDGSGVEIPSPVLEGQAGLNELARVLELLRTNGFYVSDQDGLHVHHDAPEFVDNIDLTIELVEAWNANQTHIGQFVAPARRQNHWACATWTDHDVENLKASKESSTTDDYGYRYSGYRYGPRGALNIGALREHGTIEIRQHEGTLDFDEVYAWIHFGQAFIDSVLNKRVKTCSDSAELLKNIRISAKSERTLLAKAAA